MILNLKNSWFGYHAWHRVRDFCLYISQLRVYIHHLLLICMRWLTRTYLLVRRSCFINLSKILRRLSTPTLLVPVCWIFIESRQSTESVAGPPSNKVGSRDSVIAGLWCFRIHQCESKSSSCRWVAPVRVPVSGSPGWAPSKRSIPCAHIIPSVVVNVPVRGLSTCRWCGGSFAF